MREYVGTVSGVIGETVTLIYESQGHEKHLSAKLATPDATKKIVPGIRVKIIGDCAGNLGAGALTTFTVREIEFFQMAKDDVLQKCPLGRTISNVTNNSADLLA